MPFFMAVQLTRFNSFSKHIQYAARLFVSQTEH